MHFCRYVKSEEIEKSPTGYLNNNYKTIQMITRFSSSSNFLNKLLPIGAQSTLLAIYVSNEHVSFKSLFIYSTFESSLTRSVFCYGQLHFVCLESLRSFK